MLNETSSTAKKTRPTPTADALQGQVGGDHYKRLVIQPVEYIEKNKIGFLAGNAITYLTRFPFKGGAEDIKKAIHFCQFILEMVFGVKTVFLTDADDLLLWETRPRPKTEAAEDPDPHQRRETRRMMAKFAMTDALKMPLPSPTTEQTRKMVAAALGPKSWATYLDEMQRRWRDETGDGLAHIDDPVPEDRHAKVLRFYAYGRLWVRLSLVDKEMRVDNSERLNASGARTVASALQIAATILDDSAELDGNV